MGGDITRSTFHRRKHYRKVRMQQGRVQLDADWNEQVDIDSHQERTSLNDVVGHSGTPVDSLSGYSDGFKVVQSLPAGAEPAPGTQSPVPYWVMAGRYYVDGVLCENEENISAAQQPDLPQGPFVFINPVAGPASTSVTVTGEGFAQNAPITKLSFGSGSVLPSGVQTDANGAFSCTFQVPPGSATGPTVVAAGDGTSAAEAVFTVSPTVVQPTPDPAQQNYPTPSAPGIYVAFLDVWERDLTSIEDPSIREVALLGPDTATRKKVVWQVKTLSLGALPTAPAQPAGGAPVLSLFPASGGALTPFTITGSGFAAGEKVALSMSQGSLTSNLTSDQSAPTTDANGSFTATFSVPELPSGAYTIMADGYSSDDTASATFTIVGCGDYDTQWQAFLSQSQSTGRLRARALPPAPNTEPCIIPPQAGYIGLENQLYRVEVHAAGQVPATGSSPLPTFKWSRNNASVLAGITAIANNTLTVSGTGKDGNLGFSSDPDLPPVWVEVISDMQELWGKAGTLAQLTDVSDNVLTFDSTSTVGPPIDSTNYPSNMNPKVRRWDCSPAPCSLDKLNNYGYFDLENGVQVRFEAGLYNVGDYWLIPARTATANVEWPLQTNLVDWSKVPNNVPAPSDSATLTDFLVQTLGLTWLQGQPFTQNASNPNEIDVTSSDGKHTLALTMSPTPAQVVITIDGSPIGQTISVANLAGLSMLECTLPAPLPPRGIEHHYERLALLGYSPGAQLAFAPAVTEPADVLLSDAANSLPPVVSISPQSVNLSPGQGTTARLTIANPAGGDDIYSAVLTSSPPAGITVGISPSKLGELLPGGNQTASLSVATSPSTSSGTYVITVNYAGTGSLSQPVASASMTITIGASSVVPFVLSDCRMLFPASTDVPRLFYVSGDGQTANPVDSTGYCPLPAPVMAATWFGKVRFTLVKGSGRLSNPFDSTVTPVSGQGSYLDVEPGSGTPNSGYPDLDGIASCAWALDAATPQQVVMAELLDEDGDLTEHQAPLYYSAVLQSGQAQAQGNTGIVELRITADVLGRLQKGVTFVFGPFQHSISASTGPPAIILGYVGFRSSLGGDFPKLGRVTAMEDAGLYPFSTEVGAGVYDWTGKQVPPVYLNPFSTQSNPGPYSTQANPMPMPLFKALFIDQTNFSVALDKVSLPTNANGQILADTLVLRWWAVPGLSQAEVVPPNYGDPKQFWWNQPGGFSAAVRAVRRVRRP